MSKKIKKVGVIGAGQMGNGIAHVCALAGHDVYFMDIDKQRLPAAMQLGWPGVVLRLRRRLP